MNYLFKGVATALYTPFTKDGIDFEGLEKLICRQLKAKIDALVFLGTTGESPTVTRLERRQIIKFAVSKLKGKIPIIIGTGSNCTATACELTAEAKDLGADASLIVTPYYNRCEQEGLLLHYKEISNRCKFPFIIYNVPKRTGVNVEPETAVALFSNDYAVGLKEASTDKNHIESLFMLSNKRLPVYCGSDELSSFFLETGSMGAISVASNVIPCKFKEFISDFESNYEKHNLLNQSFFKEFFKLLSSKVNPIPIKCIAEILYEEKCNLRLPLSTPDKAYFEYLNSAISKLIKNNDLKKEDLC